MTTERLVHLDVGADPHQRCSAPHVARLIVCGLTTAALLAPAATASGQPTVRLSTLQAPVGHTVHVEGWGFNASNTRVKLSLLQDGQKNATPMPPFDGCAVENGSFSCDFTVFQLVVVGGGPPASSWIGALLRLGLKVATAPGMPTGYTFQAIGDTANEMATSPFAIGPTISISPSSGPPGTQVTITGRGFNWTDVLNFIYFDPQYIPDPGEFNFDMSGTPLSVGSWGSPCHPDSKGRVSCTVTIPKSAPNGTYPICACMHALNPFKLGVGLTSKFVDDYAFADFRVTRIPEHIDHDIEFTGEGRLDYPVTISPVHTLTIGPSAVLRIRNGGSITVRVSGTLHNRGSLSVESGGSVTNRGTLVNAGFIGLKHYASLTNWGTATNENGAVIQNAGSLSNPGALNNQGTISTSCAAVTGNPISGNPTSVTPCTPLITSSGLARDPFFPFLFPLLLSHVEPFATGVYTTDTPTITGTVDIASSGGEPLTIRLYNDDETTGGNWVVVGTTVTDAEGRWSIVTSPLSYGLHRLYAEAETAQGNVSFPSPVVDIATTMVVIRGSAGCAHAGGGWDEESSSCTSPSLGVAERRDTILVIPADVTFEFTTPFSRDNNGTLINRGTFLNKGHLFNQGTIHNSGAFRTIDDPIDESFPFQQHGDVDNTGTFNNLTGASLIVEPSAQFRNWGILNNAGTVTISDGVFQMGFPGGSSILNNYSIIDNAGTFDNEFNAPIVQYCGAAINGNAVSGGQPVRGSCPPVGTPQSLSTPEQQPLAVTLAGVDAEERPLTFAVVTAPAHGALTGTAPNLVYTPAAGFVGLDGFTFTASNGEEESAPATVAISVLVDTTPPVFTPRPPLEVEATSAGGAVVNYAASAYDTVDGAIVGVCAPSGLFPLGTTNVTCTASDRRGNQGAGIFQVRVIDTKPPVFLARAPLAVEATGPGGAAFTFAANASDVVDGIVEGVCTPNGVFPLGTTRVTCSATDRSGNQATGIFDVSVVDTTPPSLTVPGAVTTEATAPDGAQVEFYDVTAVDIVDGTIAPICVPASRSVFPLGATDVTCAATDSAGNRAEAGFTVSVIDTIPPDTSIASLTDPDRQSIQAGAFTLSANAVVTFGGSDLVGVDRFECSLDGAIFAACVSPITLNGLSAANHTFAVRAIDTSGNTDGTPATSSWNVVVVVAPEGLAVTLTTDASGNTVISAADGTTGETIVQVSLPPGTEIPSGRMDLDVIVRGVNIAADVTGVRVPYPPGKSIAVRSTPESTFACIIDRADSVLAVGLPDCGTTNASISQVRLTCDGAVQTFTGFPDAPFERQYTCTPFVDGTSTLLRVDGLVNSFVLDYDACPALPGTVGRQGCPVATTTLVELHVVDQAKSGVCPGGAGSCRMPVPSADLRIFDRNKLQGLAITTLDGRIVTLPKNPAGSLYDDVFESTEANAGALAASLGCITDPNGTCAAGIDDTGDYLVIVRARFATINAIVYTGSPLGPEDFADTDGNGLGDLANKPFQILVTVERDGTIRLKANSRTVIKQ